MSINRASAFASLHLPDSDSFVEGARDDEIGLGVEVDAEDVVGVAAEDFEALERGTGVPDADSAVVGGGRDVVWVGGPGDIGDATEMAD